MFLKEASISYVSRGMSRHEDFWVNQANETLKAKQVEWRELQKTYMNETSLEKEVWIGVVEERRPLRVVW